MQKSCLTIPDTENGPTMYQNSDDTRHFYNEINSVSFEVIQDKIEMLKKRLVIFLCLPQTFFFVFYRCQELNYPLLEEYDFQHDTILKNLNIELRPDSILRPYQEESLRKMFNNGKIDTTFVFALSIYLFFSLGRARSGLIVLPCGRC
jgi:DNA excision repair protein ERCC-3